MLAVWASAGLHGAWLAEVRSVYIMPMANGMDQYLADRLTREHVLTVVTDPKVADAVITDRLGLGFQEQLFQLRPELKPPPPPKPKSADKDANKDSDGDKDADKDKDEKKDAPIISSFRTAKGTVFLVHVRTQQVVWSTYQKPGNTGSREMERTAERIVKVLAKEMNPTPAPEKK